MSDIIRGDTLREKRTCLEKAMAGMSDNKNENITKKRFKIKKQHHYTSLSNLFNILEGDSIWVSSSRFSNDCSEEKLLGEDWIEKNNYQGDNYILCTCDNSDQLSQWRGYCPHGGAAIQLDIARERMYSVLHADYDVSKKFEKYLNASIPVYYTEYTDDGYYAQQVLDAIERNIPSDADFTANDMVPFLKNDKFQEERESRMVFSNTEGQLSKCVRFRRLNDGTMVPYMVIKAGCIAENLSSCMFDASEANVQKLLNEAKSKGLKTIKIPEGSNQEALYYTIAKYVDAQNKMENLTNESGKYRINCEGHLPITKIITAPTYNRERVKERIERYCKSKYWLKDVIVECSSIPYIPPSE